MLQGAEIPFVRFLALRAANTLGPDAELAARAALSKTATALPKDTNGIVEAIRQLYVARVGALKARTAALQQLDGLLITAPEQLRTAADQDESEGKSAHGSDTALRPTPFIG